MLAGKSQGKNCLGVLGADGSTVLKGKFWGIYFRCLKVTEVACLMIHKMAVVFLHEFEALVFRYFIHTGLSAVRDVVCDIRTTLLSNS
jgi:hypothetical protein